MTTAADWWKAGKVGSYTAASPVGQGFLHLSTMDLIELPANALFRGRRDLLLLCIDPERLTAPLRWEAGTPADPPEARFPHLYGVLDLAAVTAVVAYRPAADGRFHRPAGIPSVDGRLPRVIAFEHHLARQTAQHEYPFSAGFGVRHSEFPHSYEHNRLIVTGPADPEVVLAAAAEALAGLDYHKLSLRPDIRPVPTQAYRDIGYRVETEVLMVATRAPDHAADPGIRVSTVDLDELVVALRAAWSREIPKISADTVTQLIQRNRLTEAAVQVRRLAVRVGAQWVARAELQINGGTAHIDDVMTEPDHRGRGYARALVLTALEGARSAGCDLIFLRARAHEWPREFYRRLGFVEVGHAMELHRPQQSQRS